MTSAPTRLTSLPDTAAALGAWSRRRLVVARTWLATGPVCSALAVLQLLGAAAVILVPGLRQVHSGFGPFAGDLHHPSHLYPLLTAWAGQPGSSPFARAALLVTLGILVERLLGSRRFLLTAVASHVLGVGSAFLGFCLMPEVGRSWARSMLSEPIAGVLLILLGPFMASTVLMNRTWRRRARVVTLGAMALMVAVSGTSNDLARFMASVTGLVIALLLWRGESSTLAGPRRPHSTRLTLALIVTAWAATMALSIVSPATGPLSGARFGLLPTPTVEVTDLTGRLQALMPVLLQLTLAEGLRRGRRVALIGTVTLQTLLAVCAALGVALTQIGSGSTPVLFSPGWLVSSNLLLPVLLNLSVILLVVWNRKELQLRTRPGVVGHGVLTWLSTVAVAGAVCVLGGMLVREQFLPEATPLRLLRDYVANLMPVSVTVVVLWAYPLVQLTVLAKVLVGWTALTSWATAVVCTWLALRQPAVTAASRHEDLRDLVRSRGAGTLGWMATWPGNEAWVDSTGTCGFAYRAGSGAALSLGDPACVVQDTERAVEGFASFASQAGLVPALYSIHEPTMLAARARGWTIVQVAEEAIIDLPDLAFRGKAFQDVRTALNHAQREGIRAEWTRWSQTPAGRRDQVKALFSSWLDGKALPEMGFTLGGLAEIDDEETRLLLAVDQEGTIHAVTSWMPVYRDGYLVGLTLDVMRRREGGWRPAIEYLIARAAQDAQAEGLEILSLSGAPLARSGTSGDLNGDGHDEVGASRFDPLTDLLASVLEPAYGFASLHSFKRKFKPRYVPMYLAVPDITALPTVGVAIGRAYLPGLTPSQAARFAQVLVSRD